MKKQISFKTELGRALGHQGPYMFLASIVMGAALSQGSWSVFFDKTFPRYLFLMAGVWLVMGLYVALKRNETGVDTDGVGADDDLPVINTASGMGMPGDGSGGIDMGGNLLGHHDHD